jgi:hypothetical protein
MTQIIFDNVVELFKKRFNILININTAKEKSKDIIDIINMDIVVENKNPWDCMLKFFEINNKIISYFDTINKEWCKKYHEEKIIFPGKPTPFPLIFIDFQNYVEHLMNEEYLECEKIKNKIYKY